MKKLLSITLAVALVMSLFCVVPVSAADYADFKLPYAFADFEDGKTVFGGRSDGKYTSEVVDDATRGGKVTQITVDDTVNGYQGNIYDSTGYTVKPSIAVGDEITVSMWIKTNAVLSKGQFSLYFNSNYLLYEFDKDNTDWQYVTSTVTSEFEVSGVACSYRFGTSTPNKVDGDTNPIYLIDDFEIKIVKASAVGGVNQATAKKTRVLLDNDFSSNANGISVIDANNEMVGEYDAEEGVYRITDTSTTARPRIGLTLSEPLVDGMNYAVTLKARLVECKNNGTDLDAGTAFEVRMFPDRNNQNFCVRNDSGLKNNNTWKDIGMVISRRTGLNNTTLIEYRFFHSQKPYTCVLEIDDVKVTAFDSVFNGDFENYGDFKSVTSTTSSTSTVGRDRDMTTDYQAQNYYYWWTSDNTSNQIKAHTDYGYTNAGASMKFVTYGSKFQSNTYVIPGTIYNITGKIKAVNAESAGNVEVGMIYDGTAVPFGTVAISESGWTDVNTASYEVPAGVTASSFYISPVAPEGTAANAACAVEILSDDWALTQRPAAGTPSVTATGAEMAANGAVTAAYTFATEGNVADVTDASVYKLVANGKYYGTFYDKNAIVVPEAAREVSGLSLEIVPVASNGYIGAPVTVAIEAAEEENPIVGISISRTANGITVATDTELVAAKLIFVTYDANNKMTTWHYDTTVALGAQESREYPIPDGFASAKVMLWRDMSTTCEPLTDVLD